MSAPEIRCPGCGETRLIERVQNSVRWICSVCSRTWTPKEGTQ